MFAEPAPSEEFVLHCDADCSAQLSLVAGVLRSAHGWGRLTLYDESPTDYDLCAFHLKAVRSALHTFPQG